MLNVLIPTDFSQNAWNATKYGIQFFKNETVNLHLLHVDSNTSGTNLDEPSDLKYRELARLNKQIKVNFPRANQHLHIHNRKGNLVEEVRKAVDLYDINFIVMGTKGASAGNNKIVGTKTDEVIRRVKSPLIIVPENASYKESKEIVLPTDFNNYFKSKILLTLAEVICLDDSSIRVVHISKGSKILTKVQIENKELLEDFLEGKSHSFHFLKGSSMEEILFEFIVEKQINLIAMAAKNINYFHQILFQPLKLETNYLSEIPFLVLHE